MLALNGLRVSEATGADIQDLGVERGHRTLVITRKGGKVVTVPLAPRSARAIDLAIGERCEGPIFLCADSRRLDRHGAARIVRRVGRRAGIAKPVGPHMLRHAFITAAQMSRIASDARFPGKRESRRPAIQRTGHSCVTERSRQRSAADLRCHHPVASDATMMHPVRLHRIPQMMQQVQPKSAATRAYAANRPFPELTYSAGWNIALYQFRRWGAAPRRAPGSHGQRMLRMP